MAGLSLVPDDLDDDTHARLDEAVMRAFDEPPKPTSAVFLLVEIFEQRHHRISLAEGREILARHPELMEKLKVAWVKKSFREIRRLGSSS
jgi:hypothetical protein